jgi:hypothetical protein
MGTQEKVLAAAALALLAGLYGALRWERRETRHTDATELDELAREAPALEPGVRPIDAERRVEETRVAVEDGAAPALTTAESGLAELEIQVQRGEAIAHDARAWLVSGYHRELPEDLGSPTPGIEPLLATADPEGVLRFAGLAPGPYRAAIQLADIRLEQGVRLLEGRATARIVIRLGSATVEGLVFDEQGTPRPGALVRLCRRGYGRNPPPFECFARTDANGFYRIQQVGSGPQLVEAHLGGSMRDGATSRDCMVPFSGVVRVDFGSSALERVSWSGVARNAAGDPVPGPGEIRVQAGERGELSSLPLRADGSFELRLQPGPHHVWVQPAGFFPRQVDLGVVDVPAGGLQRDLVVPGTRLRLALELPLQWKGRASATLREREGGQTPFELVELADGTWVQDGFEPGDYVLTAAPLHFAATHGPEYPVTLPPGRAELALELLLEEPR